MCATAAAKARCQPHGGGHSAHRRRAQPHPRSIRPRRYQLYVSGQMSTEAQYLANKLAKGYIGTNLIESNSRLCMASAGPVINCPSVPTRRPAPTRISKPPTCFCHRLQHGRLPPHFVPAHDGQGEGRGQINRCRPAPHHHGGQGRPVLHIKPGTDLALLNGLLHLLHKAGHTNPAFIAQFTQGWEAVEAMLPEYTPQAVSRVTGLAVEDIQAAAELIAAAPEFMTCWTMGLNQSTHGTWNTNAICNLHLATGKICRPGSGPFSLTGQPNAMGGREMGYMGPGLPGQRSLLVAAERAEVEARWGCRPAPSALSWARALLICSSRWWPGW